MKEETTAILLRIFVGESDRVEGKPLYQYLTEYLKENNYSGVTVLRGITGYGHASKIHTANILSLSSDLPIVIEIVDYENRINELKDYLDRNNIIECGLITEEKVNIIRYGKDKDAGD